MRLELSPAQRDFVDEIETFLDDWSDVDGYLVSENAPRLQDFYRALAARNWLALCWPREYGGLARPLIDEYLLWNLIGARRIARPPQGVGVVAKTLMRVGTDAQKAAWLPKIRLHQGTFALAYSEPEAGSDLASLRCRATRDGDHYVIQGNKCWNSRAHLADFLWLLCRTGSQEAHGKGLTLLIVDTRQPGVDIRPIRLMDGNVFTEIFLDDVRVPAECRIGGEGEAWKVMADALADERHVHFGPARVLADLAEALDWLGERAEDGRTETHAALFDVALDVLEAQALGLKVLEKTAKGEAPVAEVASNKIAHVKALQSIARTAMRIGGVDACLDGSPLDLLWRQTMTESIGGGTTEIMLGIVARRRLGLGASR